MKQKFIVLFSFLCLFSLLASAKKADPTNASHFIKGDYSVERVNGKMQYKLTNVTSEGIRFNKEGTWFGTFDKDNGYVSFEFSRATTSYAGGFKGSKLEFWAFDADINEWQHDMEVIQGESSTQVRKEIVIMLVLDCSTSMGPSDFDRVKQSAKSFLNKMYLAANNGNIKVGIIGFNTVANANHNTYAIQPLTSTSYNNMLEFVDQLYMANGTAMYYSIDKAASMMQSYTSSKTNVKNLEKAYMLVFTDGIDNTSVNYEDNINTVDAYYTHAKSVLEKTQIAGTSIESHIIAVPGKDIATEAQQNKFDRLLSSLSTDYRKLSQYSELENIFNELADNLITSWQTITCYIPAGRVGTVCWTLGEVKEVVAEPVVSVAPKARKTMLVGANLAGGIGAQGQFGGYWSVGVDFAYPVAPKFGLGAYLSGGMGMYTNYGAHFMGGMLATIGDMSNDNAVVIGLGAGIENEATMGNVRGGYLWHNGLYLLGELSMGAYPDATQQKVAFDLGLHIGYNFGKLIK